MENEIKQQSYFDAFLPVSVEDATREATHAFWAKIAEVYPEVKTGDMDPVDVVVFQECAENCVNSWLQINGKFQQ